MARSGSASLSENSGMGALCHLLLRCQKRWQPPQFIILKDLCQYFDAQDEVLNHSSFHRKYVPRVNEYADYQASNNS